MDIYYKVMWGGWLGLTINAPQKSVTVRLADGY